MDYIDKYTGWTLASFVPFILLLLTIGICPTCEYVNFMWSLFYIYLVPFSISILVWYYHLFCGACGR